MHDHSSRMRSRLDVRGGGGWQSKRRVPRVDTDSQHCRLGQRAIQSCQAGSTRATGVCWSMISLTSTPQAEQSGARQGSSRALAVNQPVSTCGSRFIAARC